MILKQEYLESLQKPFPVSAMPQSVQSFVRQAAKSIGVNHSVIALPLLCTLAAAIGNTKRIRLKHGYSEPGILWGLVIARSGESKSPAIEAATRSMVDVERVARLANQQAIERWESDKIANPGSRPPIESRFVTNNPTIQAIMLRLAQNPRGLFLIRQELGAWLGSFNQFSRGGGDEQIWLEMFDGRFASDDRKGGENRSLHVDSANVSIIGGIQPGIMFKTFPRDRIASGMLPRFLLTRPPSRPALWSDDELPDSARANVDFIVKRLTQLPFGQEDQPEVIGIAAEAKAVFREYHDQNAKGAKLLPESIGAAYSKLRSYAARIALVLHATEIASSGEWLTEGATVSADTMSRAVKLTQWFAHEAKRVYSDIDGEALPAGTADAFDLVGLIQRKGGEITPRDVVSATRRFKTVAEAEVALGGLKKGGFGEWVDRSTPKGRSIKVFALAKELNGEETTQEDALIYEETGEV